MNHLFESFGLHCPDGREAQLLSVQVQGEILGLMLRLTVRQTWRNASGAPMATRLNFPLGVDQTLLDLSIERAQGRQAITQVARESRQRCSATPGVLATGEQVTLQWRIGQLLDLQGGSLRLQLPAALVPRAPRPAQIGFEIHDPVAQGTVGSPSHELHRVRHAQGTTLSLRTPAGLDKDVVLTVHGLRDSGFALACRSSDTPDTCTVLMSGSPRLSSQAAQPLRMKLLLDTSSTMPAERLSQIRAALDRLLAQLQAQDQLSYSRFGERALHDLPRLQVCTEAYLRRVRALARHSDAPLGPPAPQAALQSVLALTDEDEATVTQADILLITSSPIWAIDASLRALRTGGHRLHVMALGDAGESLWRELAHASGGSFELLAPGQHSLQTLSRLIERMRHLQPTQVQLEVQNAHLLHPDNSQALLADGDTLHLWTQVQTTTCAKDLTGRPELQASLQWQAPSDEAPHTLASAAMLWDEQGDLARLCAARELPLIEGADERQQRIAQHRLVLPDCTRISTAVLPPLSAQTTPAPVTPKPQHARAPQSAQTLPSTSNASPTALPLRKAMPRHVDLAGWLSEPTAPGNPLSALVQCFNAQAATHTLFRAALSGTLHQVPTRFLDGLVLRLARPAGNPGRVWASLLHWLHAEHELTLSMQALRLIEDELASLPVAVRKDILGALALAAQPQNKQQAA